MSIRSCVGCRGACRALRWTAIVWTVLFAAAPGRLLAADEPGALTTVRAQPAWIVRNAEVELAVTRLGGQMAPVTFYRNSDRPIAPYYVSPWQGENLPLAVPVEVPLRGDFFCMPFGGNGKALGGEKQPPHGETAGSPWTFVGLSRCDRSTTLTLSIAPKVRPGKVTKQLTLVDGQNVIYSRHLLEGFSGPMPLGHHPTLRMPDEEGALRVSSSPFVYGMTCPVLFSNPAQGAYQSLAIGRKFSDLRSVPTLWKNPSETDLTRFPARDGFTDLAAIFKRASTTRAWMAVANPKEGYLWFSLKNAEQLPATVFWIENRGRHGAPWNGRNRCLGLEDVCAYFAEGLVESVGPNAISASGIPTAIALDANRPTVVCHIQGVVRIPTTFQQVASVEFGPRRMTFVAPDGRRVAADVYYDFLKSGQVSGSDDGRP
jgi:hypothetical protein